MSHIAVMSGNRKKIALATIIISLVTLSIITYGILESLSSHEIAPEGTPIDETTFAELVGNTSNSAMLPGEEVISTNYWIRMRVDYRGYTPSVTLGDAVNSSLEFLSQFSYLSNLTLTPDSIWNRLTDDPIYTLRFFVDEPEGAEIYTAVNAMTGKIISFSPGRRVLEPLKKNPASTNLLTTEEVEARAKHFLSENNYTLSQFMRYSGPIIFNDTTFIGFPIYRLYFSCVINNTKVDGNGLSLELDIETGEVLLFSYRWIHISGIPNESTITAREAELSTIQYLTSEEKVTGFSILTSSLRFRTINSFPIYEFWLCWYIELESEYIGYVIVNAISGSVLSIGWRVIWD